MSSLNPLVVVLLLFCTFCSWFAGAQSVATLQRTTERPFYRPTCIASPNDGSGRVFFGELPGRLTACYVNEPGAPCFQVMDLQDRILFALEQGLFAAAFHPDFEQNGWLFVLYSAGTEHGRVVLSRFTFPVPSENVVDQNSEVILLELPQPHYTHNGGGLVFGQDGYLYLGVGDGMSGSPPDPFNNAQDLNSLYGKILRLDVSETSLEEPYRIPVDNPFLFPDTDFDSLIVESRDALGVKTTADFGYFESGNFQDLSAKSKAPGLKGFGTRVSGEETSGQSVYFRANPPEGMYNIYVTLPDAEEAFAPNAKFTFLNGANSISGKISLSREVASDQWELLRDNIYMDGVSDKWIKLEVVGDNERLVADAVKFERIADLAPEIYAFGIRNPWRMTLDRATGDIYVGDVGEISYEEVNVIKSRGNYGWPVKEGAFCQPQRYRDGNCNPDGYVDPVFAYGRALCCSITGGYIYRGSLFPDLFGYYIFADFCGGVYAVDLSDNPTQTDVITLIDDRQLWDCATLGESPDGEILVSSYSKNTIYTLVPVDGTSWLFF